MEKPQLPTTTFVPPPGEAAGAESQPAAAGPTPPSEDPSSLSDNVVSLVDEIVPPAINLRQLVQEEDAQRETELSGLHTGMSVGPQDRYLLVQLLYTVPGKTAVWLARDRELNGRDIAIKVVFAGNGHVPLEGLLREAEKTASLDRKYAPIIYGKGSDPQRGFAWLAMEYIRGETLAQHLRKVGRMSWDQARNVCRDVLQGLRDGFHKGMVHRDVKPANVMWDEKLQTWKLVDWGLGMAFSLTTGLAQDRLVSGTYWYIAPESWSTGEYSPQSDFYAVGVMLVEMLSGENPFADVSHSYSELRKAHEEARLADFPDLPEEARPIIARATDRDPRRRYQSAEDFLADLEERKPRRFPGRRSWLRLALAAVIVVALALDLFLLRPAPPRPQYRGTFTLWLAGRGAARFPEAMAVGGPNTLPLHSGNSVILEARLDQGPPAHHYVIWINSEGKYRRFFPTKWQADRLPTPDKERADLRLPANGGVMDLGLSQPGRESILWLVRDRPLTAEDNAEIDELLQSLTWRPPPKGQGEERAVFWENGLRSQERDFPDLDRVGEEGDPIEQTEKLLLALKERGLVSYSRALCYPFAGR